MIRLAPLLALLLAGCHMKDVNLDRHLPVVARFVPGKTTYGRVLEHLGPPAAISTLGDNNGDFETTLRPNAGDLVSVPDQGVVVSASGGALSVAAGPLP